MKKLLFALFAYMSLTSCNEEKPNDFVASTLSFSTYLEPVMTEDGKLNTIHVDFYLFGANDAVYEEIQDASILRKWQAIDTLGNFHKASKSLTVYNGNTHLFVDHGKYFMVLLVHETGRYSHVYIDIEEGKLTTVKKVFASKFPENSHEAW